MNHPPMTNRTATTLMAEEMKKRAGAVKGIDETDRNDIAFKLVTMAVFSLCYEYSFFLLFFCFFYKVRIPPPPPFSSFN